MVAAWPVHRKVRLYASPNLKEWTHLSDFGPAGSTNGIWECPDLFPLPVERQPRESKWVLVVNVGSGAPAGGSGCQYFVGDFDGTRFNLDRASQPKPTPSEPALWADYGRDFYAAVSWSDIPKRDGRRLWLGWMSNWNYAQDVPTSPWRSAMSVPRELSLRTTSEGLRLMQRPVRELSKLRDRHHRLRNASLNEANAWLQHRGPFGELFEIEAEFEPTANVGNFDLAVRTAPNEEVRIGCDAANGQLSLDRTHSGRTDFHPKFAAIHEAPLRLRNGRVRLRVFVDISSIEVFANDGESVVTDLAGDACLPQCGWPLYCGNGWRRRIGKSPCRFGMIPNLRSCPIAGSGIFPA